MQFAALRHNLQHAFGQPVIADLFPDLGKACGIDIERLHIDQQFIVMQRHLIIDPPCRLRQ